MKTAQQLAEWCAGASADLGDPSAAVCQLFLRWQENLQQYKGDDLSCGLINGQLAAWLPPLGLMQMDVDQDGPVIAGEQLLKFGAQAIAPGLWALSPSLNVPGEIHGFVTLYGVPDPAPWERRILLAGGLR